MRYWRIAVTLALALTVLSTVALACGGGEGSAEDRQEVEDAIRAAREAFKNGDVDTFLAALTDKAIEGKFEATREEAREFEELSDVEVLSQFELREVSNIEVSGDTATAEDVIAFGKVLERERVSLIKEGDVWKIDGFEDLPVEIPGGVATVDVEANEFAFGFNPNDIENGNIAFVMKNLGKQPHMLVLFRVTEEFDIEEALQTPEGEEPEGIEEQIGGIEEEVEPGDSANLVFTGPLDSGRYIMLCFVADPESGKEHFELGMHADFTVP